MKFSMKLLFVLLVPFLCEGTSVQLTMPSYVALRSSTMRVTCNFTTSTKLSNMILLHGGDETKAYLSDLNNYKIDDNNKVILEVGPGTTVRGGSLTFIIHWISCADITWYMCKGIDLYYPVNSENRTLKVLPQVHAVMNLSEITVKEYSEFMCQGTINKMGHYSVNWYRKTPDASNRLLSEAVRINDGDQCSRSVSSTLIYQVKDYDKPKLIIWCQIQSELVVNKMRTFNVQGPHLSVQLTIHPSNTKKMRVTCSYTSSYIQSIILFFGNNQIKATYEMFESTFAIPSNNRIGLEVSPETTRESGTLTFIFSWIMCSDFTSYMCQANEILDELDSEITTLKALPNVNIVKVSTLELAVNDTSVFACKATIHKEGPFSVKWYQGTIAPSNQLNADEPNVVSEDQCSRTVSSSLTYDVKQSDGAKLVFWCSVNSNGIVSRKRNFYINGAGSDLMKSRLPHLVVTFIACLFYLF